MNAHFAGQPDDAGQRANGGSGEHCVDFWADHGNTWDDNVCSLEQSFVCECNPDEGREEFGFCKYDNEFGKK